MVATAVMTYFNGTTVPYASYNSADITLGPLMLQNSGASDTDSWVGPIPISIARPDEQTFALAAATTPRIWSWSSTIDWIFLANNTAAATTKFQMWTFNRASTGSYPNNAFTYVGGTTVTWPTATNYTVRDMAPYVYTYSTGTVAVSGTAVTGTSTAWQTARFAAGARIGFGTTSPGSVTTWYNISSIGSDTTITLTSTAGTISSGTAFVIEELRLVVGMTNATTTNGGLCVVKGLNPSVFTTTGTSIAAATTVDNIQASYWLADASTETNTVAAGVALDNSSVSNTSHPCYVLNGTTTAAIYEYNLRAALTLTSGKDPGNSLVLATGVSATLTGTCAQYGSMCIATASHGPGNGVKCLYFATSTKIYRAIASNVTSGSTTFLSDSMSEIPTGGTNAYAATSTMRMIQYSSVLDRFFISTNSGAQMYCTQYNPSTTGFDQTFLANNFQEHQSIGDTTQPWNPTTGATVMSFGESTGMLYLNRDVASVALGQMYNLSVGAHWTYATSTTNMVISPAITIPSTASALYGVFFNEAENLGGAESGISPEPYRVYYRTTGISGNTGAWTALDLTGSLSGVSPSSGYIQFMFQYKVLGKQCIPARLYNCCLVYENSANIPTYYEWSVNASNTSNGTVGWNQISLLGHTPTFTINYYREDTSANVLTDTSTGNVSGQFNYWNGSSFVAGVGSDSTGVLRQYVPSAGLPSNVNLYVQLSVV